MIKWGIMGLKPRVSASGANQQGIYLRHCHSPTEVTSTNAIFPENNTRTSDSRDIDNPEIGVAKNLHPIHFANWMPVRWSASTVLQPVCEEVLKDLPRTHMANVVMQNLENRESIAIRKLTFSATTTVTTPMIVEVIKDNWTTQMGLQIEFYPQIR